MMVKDPILLLVAIGVGIGIFTMLIPKAKRNPLHIKNRKQAKQLLKYLKQCDLIPARIFGLLRTIDFFVFEELLLLCFKERGFSIKHNQAYTGDGGIDGTVFDQQGHKFLIQAKRYKNAINPQHVSEFVNVIEREKASGGFFIHTGRTGPKAYQSLSKSVKIISGRKLLSLLNVGKIDDKNCKY